MKRGPRLPKKPPQPKPSKLTGEKLLEYRRVLAEGTQGCVYFRHRDAEGPDPPEQQDQRRRWYEMAKRRKR